MRSGRSGGGPEKIITDFELKEIDHVPAVAEPLQNRDKSGKLARWYHTLSIKRQLLVAFLSSTVVSLFLVFLLIVLNQVVLDSRTRSTATNAFEEQIERHLQTSSVEYAGVIERRLERLEGVFFDGILEALESMFSPSSPYLGGTLVFDQDVTNSTAFPGVVFDSTYNQNVNTRYSSFYIQGTTKSNLAAEMQEIPSRTDTVLRSSHLDNLLPSAYANSKDVIAIYVGFTVDKGSIFRTFPGVDKIDRTYNHLVRPWFLEGVQGGSEVITTEPYLDFDGKGWMITMSSPVRVGNEVIGVFAIDVLIDTIEQFVLGGLSSSGATGYSSLSLVDGTALAHPNFDTATASVVEKVWDIDEFVTEELWVNQISASQTTDVERVEGGPDNEIYFITWTYLFGSRYILTVLAQRKEILATIKAIEEQLSDTQTTVYATTIPLIVVCFVCVVLAVYLTASYITKPVQHIIAICKQISANATNDNPYKGIKYEATKRSDEVGDFSIQFASMLSAVRKTFYTQKVGPDCSNPYHNPETRLWPSLPHPYQNTFSKEEGKEEVVEEKRLKKKKKSKKQRKAE